MTVDRRARGRKAAAVSVFGALTLVATACGGGGGASGKTSTGAGSSSGGKGASGPLALKGSALVKAATKEGKLTFVTSLAGKDVPNYVNGFEKAYPGIHVSVDRGAETAIVPAAINEINAGKSPGDVFEGTSSGGIELASVSGALAPFVDPNAADIPASDKTAAGGNALTLVSDRVSYIGFGWNTTRISQSDVPKTFQDLLNPALRGKMGIETDDTSEEWIGLVLHEMGQQKGKAFLKQLGSKAKIGQDDVSGAEMMSLIASGQYGGSPSVFQSHAHQQKAQGAPVNWKALNGVAIGNVGEMGVFAKAKDPAAALLFIDFITSQQGRQVVKKTHLQLPETKEPFRTWVPTAGYNATSYAQAQKSWGALQKADFGG